MTHLASPPVSAAGPDAEWSPLAVTGAALGIWGCAWDLWASYLGRLAAASGPAEVLEAGAQLSIESLDMCNRMAATRLGRLPGPLLNDA